MRSSWRVMDRRTYPSPAAPVVTARNHQNVGILQEFLGELRGSIPFGNTGPNVEARFRRLDLHAHVLEDGYDAVAASLIDGVAVVHGLRRAFHGLDGHVLDGLRNARIQVRFDSQQRLDHLGIADGHPNTPSGHVVGLGKRVELDSDVHRAFSLQEAGRTVPVVGDFGVAGVVHDGDIVGLGRTQSPY